MSDWKESTIHYKYTELPEEPRYKKKKKKKKVKKSKHKHNYIPCAYNLDIYVHRNGERSPMLYYGTVCSICGRIGDITSNTNKMTGNLPVHEIDWNDKYVSL